MRPTSWPVVAVVSAVGLLDVVSGGYLLFSSTPWRAHGPDTVWLHAPDVVSASALARSLVYALFRRTGAFSFHAGMVTIAGAVLGRRDRRLMTGLLVLWMIDGVAFFATDCTSFAGTPYLVAKQVIGTSWALAFVWHLVEGRRHPPERSTVT